MTRDAARTREKLLEAVQGILEEEGFPGIGVNAVARRADVDKVLIYRYFGGLDGLLEAFAAGHAAWLSTEVLVPENVAEAEVPDVLIAILRGHLRELRRRPAVQEIMRWELNERNALTDALAREREARGLELLRSLRFEVEEWPGLDIAAVAGLVYAGLTHLVLRSRTTDHYVGLDLASEEGWDRLSAAVEALIRGVFERAARSGPEQGGDL